MDLKLLKINNGIYDVTVIANDEYIGPSITQGHEWDRWMRREARLYHKPGTHILDIGANIGYNMLMFSDYGPVIAFEPVFHQIVKMNVENNTLRHQVQVIPCALSDTQEQKEIYIPLQGCQSNAHINYGGTGFYTNENYEVTPTMVNCERLDDIYDGVPSLMKIDVEGHELNVLKGAAETIKKHKPAILIEIHDYTEENEVHVYLKSLGYDNPIEKPEAIYLYT
jgi:FkbM family methyltransferase